MKVKVKVYATLVKYVGGSIMHEPLEVDLSDSATLNDLYDKLAIPRDEVKTAFVNSVITPPDHTLNENDEIGIFPPVGGGRRVGADMRCFASLLRRCLTVDGLRDNRRAKWTVDADD